MEDKMDGLIDILSNNKKILVIAIVVYIIGLVAVLIWIWIPDEKDYFEYQTVDISEKKRELAQAYVDELSYLLLSQDTEDFEDSLSEEYLKYVDMSAKEVINELKNEGYLSLYTEIRGMDVYEDDETYVYSTTIYSKGKSKRVNIIETRPYRYTIAFDDFYKYSTYDSKRTSDDIEFNIIETYRNFNYISYTMNITNNNKTAVNFNFNDLAGVQVLLDNGTLVSLMNAVSTEETTSIEPNSTVVKTFVFNVPVQLQKNIEYIIFNGVKINFATKNINLSI